jgi:hypothetical protein
LNMTDCRSGRAQVRILEVFSWNFDRILEDV